MWDGGDQAPSTTNVEVHEPRSGAEFVGERLAFVIEDVAETTDAPSAASNLACERHGRVLVSSATQRSWHVLDNLASPFGDSW